MGFYPPDSLVHEAQRRGFEVRPADVNRSAVECCGRGRPGGADRARLRQRGAGGGDGGARRRARARRRVPEARRPRLALGRGREALEQLAWAGALEGIGVSAADAEARRRATWPIAQGTQGRPLAGRGGQAARAGGGQLSLPLPVPESPPLREPSEWDEVVADYASTGMTLGPHPMELMRPGLRRRPGAERGARADRRRRRGGGGRDGRRPPAPGDRQGGRVHAAGGRGGGRRTWSSSPPPTSATAWRCAPPRSCGSPGKLERREGVINVVVEQARGARDTRHARGAGAPHRAARGARDRPLPRSRGAPRGGSPQRAAPSSWRRSPPSPTASADAGDRRAYARSQARNARRVAARGFRPEAFLACRSQCSTGA